jgi:exopolysaccharide biosynthesis predicted pyruvyltransferase EpsI
MEETNRPSTSNLRHETCFAELATHLRAASREAVLFYVANPGNWGDAMIATGTKQMLNTFRILTIPISFSLACRLPACLFRMVSRGKQTMLVFGGGGALIPRYRRFSRLRHLAAKFDRLLLLPSTIGMDLAADPLHPRSVVFRRDHAESASLAPSSFFCHDLAFFLELPKVPIEERRGLFFRRDVEAVGHVPPSHNRDLSGMGTHRSDPDRFVQMIGRYETVYTDRLHVAIIATMLGRRTHLFPNNYFKNRAIYHSSLHERFPNVSFHEDPEPLFEIENGHHFNDPRTVAA